MEQAGRRVIRAIHHDQFMDLHLVVSGNFFVMRLVSGPIDIIIVIPKDLSFTGQRAGLENHIAVWVSLREIHSLWR